METLRFFKLQEHLEYNLIIADPPYFKSDIHQVFKFVLENKFLSENGVLIIERSIQTAEIDELVFGQKATKRLGDSLIYIFTNN